MVRLKLVIQPALHHQLGVYRGCREACYGCSVSSGPQVGKFHSKINQKNMVHKTTQSFPCNAPIPRRACMFAASRPGPEIVKSPQASHFGWPSATLSFGEMTITCSMTEHGLRIFPLPLHSAVGKSPMTWSIPHLEARQPCQAPRQMYDKLFQGTSVGANRKIRINVLFIVKAESESSWL